MARRKLVDLDTGEVIQGKSERFTQRQTEVWKWMKQAKFLTMSEQCAVNYLADQLQFNTNAIVDTKGQYLNIDGMANSLDMDRSNFRKLLKSLMRKNVIGCWKSADYEIYYMNPYLYKNGEIQKFLYNQFDQEYHERSKHEHVKRFYAGKKQTSLVVALT
jgi:hypothetical protein